MRSSPISQAGAERQCLLLVDSDRAGRQDREVGEILARFGAVPMAFTGGDEDDVAGGDVELVGLGGDDAAA
ncbi:MAG: hypothetical protein QOG89_3636, partial [Thermomicrobiales bacterium]|nr:hypothetical protein [Thermomicrobiales bacterium]